MFDTIIGMVTGSLFVTFYFLLPLLIIIYILANDWVEHVTNNEQHLSRKPLKLLDRYVHEFWQGSMVVANILFLTVGTLVYFIAPPGYEKTSFSDDMSYLEYSTMIYFELPAKAGAWASEVILIVLVYFLTTWAAKWVYSLSSRINKLEKDK